MRLRSATAADLAEAVAWYRQEAPEQVRRFRDEFRTALKLIGRRPYLFPVRVGVVRCHTMRVFPYGIWYVVEESSRTVHVLAVLHNRRDPATLATRL